MRQWVWLVVVLAGMVALGCGRKEEAPRAAPPPPKAVPEQVAPAPAAPTAPAEGSAAVTAPAEPEVLFSEDFESGEVGRWTSLTIVEGGAGGSKYAGQGTVAEGKNPEYWGLDLTVDDKLTLSLDIYFDASPTELQIMSFAQKANNNFRFQQSNLEPGRWHHIEAKLADFFSWDGGSLAGDTIQSINIWVQGTSGDTFRIDNVKLYR